jgi:hypothetical protein
MSTNKELFQQAIADAKSVREAALANAKTALEEALTPKLHSMLNAKLNELADDELEEGFTTSHGDDSEENLDYNLEESDELEEDFDLAEILASLEEEEFSEPYTDKKPHDNIAGTEKGYVSEAKDEEDEEEIEDEEIEDEETEDDGFNDEEIADEEMSVSEMSIEDLKDLIKDIVSQEAGAEDMSMGMNMGDEEGSDEEINLDELLAELAALDEKPETTSEKSEMKEAIRTIHTLRNELNEVNLLNAKLLYVNKIFKSKNLNESQKVKVIASFDRATTPKEAKIVYESLSTSLTSKPKQAIRESLGFASKATGIAPKKQMIVESNDFIARMQKLANITK